MTKALRVKQANQAPEVYPALLAPKASAANVACVVPPAQLVPQVNVVLPACLAFLDPMVQWVPRALLGREAYKVLLAKKAAMVILVLPVYLVSRV